MTAISEGYLEKIADRQSSFLIFNSRIYTAVADDLTVPSEGEDYLEAAGLKLRLRPSLSCAEFEQLEDQVQAATIEEFSAAYVHDSIQTELRKKEDTTSEVNRLRTLKFIMEEFLPFLISKRYHSDDLLLEELQDGQKPTIDLLGRAKAELKAKLEQDFPTAPVTTEPAEQRDYSEELRLRLLSEEQLNLTQVQPLISRRTNPANYHKKTKPSRLSYTQQVIDNFPLYIVEGEIFLLQSLKPDQSARLSFRIDQSNYAPVTTADFNLSDLSTAILARKELTWKIAALERSREIFQEYRANLVSKDVSESQLRGLAELSEYDLGDCGFVLYDSHYYVYTRLPKFATQDGRNPEVFWPFEPTRVAIPLGWSNNRPYSTGRPVVIEKREFHPCLDGRSHGGYRGICNLNREPDSYGHTSVELVRKLSDAARVILEPLNKPSLERHSGERYFGVALNDILKQGSLTREQAVKEGYLIVEVIESKLELNATNE